MKPNNFLTERELNIIRGKVMAGHATKDEMLSVFAHYDELEEKLDNADCDDFFSDEGWRHWAGLPDAD